MNPVRSIGGVSFVGRLLALALAPLIAVGVLATQRVNSERTEADAASELVQIVDRQRGVAAVVPPAQLERIALSGLARIDELGLSRTLIRLATGIDFEAVYASNLDELELALDELADRHRQYQLADGTTLGDRLGMIRGALITQRQLSERGTARPDDIHAVFEQLDGVLADAAAGVQHSDDGSVQLGRRRFQLDRLAHVMFSAGEHGEAVLESLVAPSEESDERFLATRLQHDIQIGMYADTLDDGQRAVFDELVATSRPASFRLVNSEDDAVELANDPDVLRESAEGLLGQLRYLADLQDYAEAFHATVDDDVRAAADAADAEATQTRTLLWLTGLLTTVLMIAVGWSIVAPLRRLTKQAARISRGELGQRPITPRGPRDIRVLTTTMNGMLATLHQVDDRIRSLAADSGAGGVGHDAEIPGSIGESLRESVRRLGTVTSRLQRSEALSSAIVAQAADAIWTVDADGTIRTANEASCALTRVSPGEQVGRPIGSFLPQTSGEVVVKVPSGPSPTALVTTSAIDTGEERITAVIAHDISERSEFERRLAYQAHHDALTGLPNRFAVLQHLEELVDDGASELAVLFVDLDGFKSVNDVQGHGVGDRVLAEVANRLSACVRDGELVGRLGGDEFVVVVRRFAQVADVVSLGHRIIREIEQPYNYDEKVFALSASVGVTLATPDNSALDTIREADNAVYQAKRRGRSRVELFDAEMQEDIDRQADLELALRNAVRSDQLVVHLQPVLDLADGSFSGAEALVRWQRPGHGLVPPNDFIPVAERSSLIFEIERWVIMRVCELVESWRRRDPTCDHRIAINISGRHLIEGDLVADVDAALGLTGADPTMLEFELTETQLLEDLDRATVALDQLRRRGIRIAVDDFGTGYSSMSYLRHLPIDAVKIDRSFVARATDHGYDSTVIEALLTIGRTLDLSVVAEGVETDEQLDYIRARGCDRAQGFLLARPMPAHDAEQIIFAVDGVEQLASDTGVG